MLTDSHCHLNYLDEPTEALTFARQRGVSTFLCIGVDEKGIAAVLSMAENHVDVYATVGEHPGAATGAPQWIEPLINHPKVVALGEMGLDYYYETDDSVRRRQMDSFRQQMAMAETNGLPVVIHTREAKQDTLDVLRDHPRVTGVLHCFTEDWDMAAQAIEMGYFISISGIVTFKQADNVRQVAQQVPLQRLLIETDSPWLAPVPHRGKQNQPGYVADTAAFLAELRGEDLNRLAEQTSENFRLLFGLSAAQ